VKRIITFGLHYMEHGLAKIRDFSLAIVRSFVFYFWDRRAAKRSLDSNPQARIHVRHIAKPGLGRLARQPPNAVDDFRGAAGGAQDAFRQKLEKRP